MVVPNCPITGERAKRLVQWLGKTLLTDLWRYTFRIDISPAIKGIDRFGLWESPAGLVFFDPPIAGDGEFYRRFYQRIKAHDRLAGRTAVRPEFQLAASHVPERAKLLDVGCGEGGFQRFVPSADYTGLDPHFGGTRARVLAEAIERHAVTHAEHYDVVCSFQVIEHVADPLAFARALTAALKPGGLLLLGVPCWPSPMVSIPNFVINAPPHHLSWWNESALRVLCARLGVQCRRVDPVPVGSNGRILYWMGRMAPRLGTDQYFRANLFWHLGLLWSYIVGAEKPLVTEKSSDLA
jgi:SAM-dependent methyltransferase